MWDKLPARSVRRLELWRGWTLFFERKEGGPAGATIVLGAECNMQATVHRIHSNLGHPPKGALVRMCQDAGASGRAIYCLRGLDRELCRARARARPARPATVPIVG